MGTVCHAPTTRAPSPEGPLPPVWLGGVVKGEKKKRENQQPNRGGGEQPSHSRRSGQARKDTNVSARNRAPRTPAPAPAAPAPAPVLSETQSRNYSGRGQTARPARLVNSTGLKAVLAHYGHCLHFLSRETASAAYAVYAESRDPQAAIAAGIENAGMLFDEIQALAGELPESLPEGETASVEETLESILSLIIEQREMAAEAATAYAVRTHYSRHMFLLTGLRNAIIGEAAASARNAAPTQQPRQAPAPAPAGTWPRRTGARAEWHDDDVV